MPESTQISHKRVNSRLQENASWIQYRVLYSKIRELGIKFFPLSGELMR